MSASHKHTSVVATKKAIYKIAAQTLGVFTMSHDSDALEVKIERDRKKNVWTLC